MIKIVKIFAVAIVAAVTGVAVYNATNDSEFTDLQNDNLEALAKEVIKSRFQDDKLDNPRPKYSSERNDCLGKGGDCVL